jgi:hypothetical protein
VREYVTGQVELFHKQRDDRSHLADYRAQVFRPSLRSRRRSPSEVPAFEEQQWSPAPFGTPLTWALGGSPPLPRPAPAITPTSNVVPGGIPTAGSNTGPHTVACSARTGPWALRVRVWTADQARAPRRAAKRHFEACRGRTTRRQRPEFTSHVA